MRTSGTDAGPPERGGDVLQHLVATGELARLRPEPRSRRRRTGRCHRQRRSIRDLLCELQVCRVVARVRLGPDQGQRAERPPSSRERYHHRAAQAEAAHRLEELGVLDQCAEHLVGDRGRELRLARPDHVRRSGRRIGVGREAPLEVSRECDFRGIGMDDEDRADRLSSRRSTANQSASAGTSTSLSARSVSSTSSEPDRASPARARNRSDRAHAPRDRPCVRAEPTARPRRARRQRTRPTPTRPVRCVARSRSADAITKRSKSTVEVSTATPAATRRPTSAAATIAST